MKPTHHIAATERSSHQPEVITSSKSLAVSSFILDQERTAEVLREFACAATGIKNPDLSQHVIIGSPGTSPDQAKTTKIGEKTYHNLPVLPLNTNNPDLIDFSEPLPQTSPTALNHRAVRFLFNIASYGTIEAPATPNPESKRTHERHPKWPKYHPLFSAHYAGEAAIFKFFQRREAKTSKGALHRQNRLIEKTAVYNKVITDTRTKPICD